MKAMFFEVVQSLKEVLIQFLLELKSILLDLRKPKL